MTRSDRSQLALAVAKAAGWAGLTLIDPNKLSGWRKHAYWLGMAGATAIEVGATPLEEDVEVPNLGFGLALASGGLIYGAQDLLARGDAWSIRFLERLGLKHPRRWAAATTFALGVGAALAEARQRPATFEDEGYDEFGQPLPETLEPLPVEVRAAIVAMLDGVDGWCGDELRRQLDDVLCRPIDGQFLLITDPDAPRTLLDSYTFPASAIFQRDGLNHVLMLDIEDGALSYLSHHVEPYPEDDSTVDWSIPSSEELVVVAGIQDDLVD